MERSINVWKKITHLFRFIAYPFNFNIFPQASPGMERFADKRFMFQVHLFFGSNPLKTSSFSFLASNNFDFNKWVKEGKWLGILLRPLGIPYLSRAEEERAQPNTQPVQSPPRDDIALDDALKEFLVSIWYHNSQFVANILKRIKIDDWLQNSEDSTLPLDPSNPFQRRITHQEIPKK
jgi:hypothetical protein